MKFLTKAYGSFSFKPPNTSNDCADPNLEYIYIFPPIKFKRQVHRTGIIKGRLGTF